jgi:hypothetical protein
VENSAASTSPKSETCRCCKSNIDPHAPPRCQDLEGSDWMVYLGKDGCGCMQDDVLGGAIVVISLSI